MDVDTVILRASKSPKESDELIEDKDEQQVTVAGETEPLKTPSQIVDNTRASVDMPCRYVDRNNCHILRDNNSAVSPEETCKNIRSTSGTDLALPVAKNESTERNNGKTIVEELPNIERPTTSRRKISSNRMDVARSSESANGRRLSSKSKENVSPKAKTEKKHNRFAFTCAKQILLRSSRERMTGILLKNISKSNGKLFDDEKVDTVNKTEMSFRSRSAVRDIRENSMNLENGIRQKTLDPSSAKEDSSIAQRKEKGDDADAGILSVNETTDDRDSINETFIVDLSSESFDRIRNKASPKKNCQKRKSAESLDDKQLNKQQTENPILTLKDNDYTTKHNCSKLDEESAEKVNVDMDIPSKDETVNNNIEEPCGKDNDASGNGENKSESSPTDKSQKYGNSRNGTNRLMFGEKSIRGNCNENARRKLRHLNAQVMPVFKRRIAESKNTVSQGAMKKSNNSDRRKDEHGMMEDVSSQTSPRNDFTFQKIDKFANSDSSNLGRAKKPTIELIRMESLILPQEKSGNKDEDRDKRCGNNERGKEEDPLTQNVSVIKEIDKCRDSKNFYHPCTDSDETLSNVESIKSNPTSPEHEVMSATAKSCSNVSEKQIRLNPELSDVNLILQRLSTDIKITKITNCVGRNLRSTSKTKKDSRLSVVDSVSSSGVKKERSELRNGVKISPKQNLSSHFESGEKFTENFINRDNLGTQRSDSWLRHYERPRQTQTEMRKSNAVIEENERKISAAETVQSSSLREKSNVTACKKVGETSNLVLEKQQRESREGTVKYVASKERNENLSKMDDGIVKRKRGRPRKERTEESQPAVKKNNKKARIDKDDLRPNHRQNLSTAGDQSDMGRRANAGRSSDGTATLNGSALTILELQHLFFKFLQHGHFRIDYEQSDVNIRNNDCHKNCMTRMRCYDQTEYYIPSNCNIDANGFGNAINPQLQNRCQNDDNANENYGAGNSNFDEVDWNSRNKFSAQFSSQMSYSRNTSPYNTQAGPPCYENLTTGATDAINRGVNNTNLWNYNSTVTANMNSLPNHMQSGYTKGPNYQQDFYNNKTNADVSDNNFYSNCYSGVINSNDSMNNGNIGTNCVNILSNTNNNIFDETNFGQSIRNQSGNSTPLAKMDSTTSDGNGMSRSSTISMRNNESLNDINGNWNLSGINEQRLDSTNEYLMERNTMSCDDKENRTIDGISDMHNLDYNSNLIMNESNLWMNRSNSTMNQGFSVLRPWHESLPIHNSYPNNDNFNYGNMFNSYGAFAGFDSQNYPFLNGRNNTDPWMLNTFSSNENEGNYATHISSNNQLSGMSSGSYPINNFSFIEGMNLSMSVGASDNTTFEATNMIDRNGDNLNIDNGNDKPNSIVEQFPENSASLIRTNDNNRIQELSQISDPYSFEYENCRQSLDRNGTDRGIVIDDENNTDNQQRESILDINDYVNEKLNNFEECFADNYTDSSNCKTVVTRTNNGETELSKLRQELADFTRQYSENPRKSPDSTLK